MNTNPENPNDFDDLADELRQAIPPLPSDALARVQTRMRAEMDRADRTRRWRGVVFGGMLAASIVVAIAGYALTYAPPERGVAAVADRAKPTQIDDRIQLAVTSVSIAPAVNKPLVRLDEYRTLFED